LKRTKNSLLQDCQFQTQGSEHRSSFQTKQPRSSSDFTLGSARFPAPKARQRNIAPLFPRLSSRQSNLLQCDASSRFFFFFLDCCPRSLSCATLLNLILFLLISSDKKGVSSVDPNISPLRKLLKGRHLLSPPRHLPSAPREKPRIKKTVGKADFFFFPPFSPYCHFLPFSTFPFHHLFLPFFFLIL